MQAAATFKAYQSANVAASHGCFNCCGKLKASDVADKGYPPGRGQYAIRCSSCGMSTFFDLKVPA